MGLKRSKFKEYWPLYLMMLPGIVYLIINNYIPMAGLAIAFKRVNWAVGIWHSPWVGLDNFRFLVATGDAFLIFRNTVLYNLGFIVVGNLLGIVTAISIDSIRNRFFRRFSQVVILIPFLLSTIIISYVVFAFLSPRHGFVNTSILPIFGMSPISWYNEAGYWPAILTIVYSWMTFGYMSIIYFATLIGIEKTYYEAAVVDGAGVWSQIRHITLPFMKTTIITLVLLAVGRVFYSDFGLFYQVPLQSGLLFRTTQTIDTYVFRALLDLNDINRAAAAGFLQSALGFIFVLTANGVVRKIEKESALF